MNNPHIFKEPRSFLFRWGKKGRILIYGPTNIAEGTVIGWETVIGSFCFIAGHIGMRCKIQGHCFIPEGVIISDDVFVGPGVIFGNVDRPRAWFKQEYCITNVDRGVTIGAGAILRPGVRIGAYALIGAGSVVTKDAPANSKVYGNPARVICQVDKDGKDIQ